jgi:hypothetical protein
VQPSFRRWPEKVETPPRVARRFLNYRGPKSFVFGHRLFLDLVRSPHAVRGATSHMPTTYLVRLLDLTFKIIFTLGYAVGLRSSRASLGIKPYGVYALPTAFTRTGIQTKTGSTPVLLRLYGVLFSRPPCHIYGRRRRSFCQSAMRDWLPRLACVLHLCPFGHRTPLELSAPSACHSHTRR